MQPQKNLAAAVAQEIRVPARLDVVTPWELPDAAKNIIAEAIAGEAWLERMGLEGVLTGITNSDMRTFRGAVERLAGMLRYARDTGYADGMRESAAQSKARAWFAGGVGFFAGGALIGAIFSFV